MEGKWQKKKVGVSLLNTSHILRVVDISVGLFTRTCFAFHVGGIGKKV